MNANDITVTLAAISTKPGHSGYVVEVDGYPTMTREYVTTKGAREYITRLLEADHSQTSSHSANARSIQVFAADGKLVFDKNIIGVRYHV